MNKHYIAIIASLLAGLAVAAVVLQTAERPDTAPADPDAAAYFDQSADTEDRIRALEAAVAEERNARQLLEEELLALYDELDALRDGPTGGDEAVETPATAQAVEMTRRAEFFRQRAQRYSSSEGRTEMLVDAGFAADRAAWIVQREDELRVEAMQARYDAQRSGEPQAMIDANSAAEGRLRGYLTDDEYGQYLEAYGRPATVAVGSVIQSSPGQLAGLQAGDEIVRYDGQRVFSYSDVNRQQLTGDPGETVVVDILRDGTPMQIVLPRGPIGIQASSYRRR